MNNNWHKKEKPLLGLTGLGGGVDGLGVTGLATKAYLDEVFSTYVYKGNGGAQQITNNIDNAGKGGLVWLKNRDRSTYASNLLFDTERGSTEYILSDSNAAEATSGSGTGINTFNADGFTLQGNGYGSNYDTENFVSWNFRQQKGFFDVVTYTGNGVDGRSISHSLGCIPGMWMVKNLDGTDNWTVGHSRMLGGTDDDYKWHLYLNQNSFRDANGEFTYSSPPTATTLSLGASSRVNGNGNNYVCYLFAGGESTADTARSVEFDGSDDQLNIADNTDFELGNGDFTLETWIKSRQTTSGYFTAIGQWASSNQSWMIRYASQDIGTGWSFFYSTNGSNYITTMGSDISDGQWHHIAVTRTGGKLRTFTDGILNTTRSTTDTFHNSSSSVTIGGQSTSGNYFDGQLSNVRLVKGTALYTSSFRPTYEPLTNITNTKLLCCNNSSVTGGTVIPSSTSTYSINVTASSSSAYTLSGNDRNGSVSGNNVTVTVNVGDTLNFAVNASGHPFYIRVSNGGYNVSTPAATGQGSQSGTVSWTPNTAGSFVYQCGNHSGMIGTITVNAASGTITTNGDPLTSTHSPFDDPEGFKFGEEGDQPIIKCGSYVGSSGTDPVYLGFEPQWVMIKAATSTSDSWGNWHIYDNMRGVTTGGNDRSLSANTTDVEESGTNHANSNLIDFTSTGFIADANGGGASVNGMVNVTYVYIAIRRPDTLVGKPAEAGTDVFAMDTGNNSSTIPLFDSGFPVDFGMLKNSTGTDEWWAGSRLTQGHYIEPSRSVAEAPWARLAFDSNKGWFYHSSYGTNYMSWMWKRHAGFDVVTAKPQTGVPISHWLNAVPEMIWAKDRGQNAEWSIYHKGLNGGTNPEQYRLKFTTDSEQATSNPWNDTAPTATHFTTGSWMNNNNMLFMLFASVDGISKVGYYDGQSADLTITTGFSPRFLIVKRASGGLDNWWVFDVTRGWASGNNSKLLNMDQNYAQSTQNFGEPTSTGFTLTGDTPRINGVGSKYIYYAHA